MNQFTRKQPKSTSSFIFFASLYESDRGSNTHLGARTRNKAPKLKLKKPWSSIRGHKCFRDYRGSEYYSHPAEHIPVPIYSHHLHFHLLFTLPPCVHPFSSLSRLIPSPRWINFHPFPLFSSPCLDPPSSFVSRRYLHLQRPHIIWSFVPPPISPPPPRTLLSRRAVHRFTVSFWLSCSFIQEEASVWVCVCVWWAVTMWFAHSANMLHLVLLNWRTEGNPVLLSWTLWLSCWWSSGADGRVMNVTEAKHVWWILKGQQDNKSK